MMVGKETFVEATKNNKGFACHFSSKPSISYPPLFIFTSMSKVSNESSLSKSTKECLSRVDNLHLMLGSLDHSGQ